MPINDYEEGFVERLGEKDAHRTLIGGLWDEMGKHQFDYLVAQGLKPSSRLLDIGCGSLRAGVRFIPYLAPNHYFGIDLVPELLSLGYEREVVPLGLADRLNPLTNLFATDDFTMPFSGVTFEYALAQSLFTHLPINHLRLCLTKLRPQMTEAGRFFATFFIAPDSVAYNEIHRHPPVGEIETFGWRDPYHYWYRDIEFAAANLKWRLDSVDDWGHPRGQKMAQFTAI